MSQAAQRATSAEGALFAGLDRDTAAILLDAATPRRFTEGYPAIAGNALNAVGDRTREMVDRLSEMTDKGIEARVAGALLRLIGQVGRPGPAGIEIAKPVTRKDIAEMTNVNYFTVSRILGNWQREGLVRLGRVRIVVVDPRRLARIAA